MQNASLTMVRVTEEKWRYWRLSVGLTYKSVWIWSSIRETVTSKIFIDFCDQSAVKFIVGWILSRVSPKSVNYFSHFPRWKIFYQKYGLLSTFPIIFSDNSTIKGGANFVLISLRLLCCEVFSLKLRILFFKTIIIFLLFVIIKYFKYVKYVKIL